MNGTLNYTHLRIRETASRLEQWFKDQRKPVDMPDVYAFARSATPSISAGDAYSALWELIGMGRVRVTPDERIAYNGSCSR